MYKKLATKELFCSDFIFVLSFYFYLYVHMCFCLHVYLCAMCMPAVFGGQMRASEPLDMKFQMAASHHVGAENWNLEEQPTILTSGRLSRPLLCFVNSKHQKLGNLCKVWHIQNTMH